MNQGKPTNQWQRYAKWLEAPPDSRDPATGGDLISSLEGLWQEVREQLGPGRFDPILGSVHAGALKKTSGNAWVQTNGDEDSGFVNLTLEFDSSEFSLNLVGWFDPQLATVERWMKKPAAWKFLKQRPEWSLVVFVRKGAKGEAPVAVFRGAPGFERTRIDLSETTPANITTVLTGLKPRLDPDDEKLSVHLRRSWAVAELDGISNLGAVVSAEVEPWLTVLPEIRIS